MKTYIKGANPYMPLWEHVPDGEPRVFEHDGEKRVYVYGSHDIERDKYCGRNYVVWSAPVNDLADWHCHGVAYETHYDSVLYAPDVVKRGDTYYMYAAECCGSLIVVASSKTPWGPFENPVPTKLGFDPGILVDDDDKVYAYWGGCAAPCYIAELKDDMATIKEGTLVENPLGHSTCPWNPVDDGHISLIDGFFEASSPRKVHGKYVYIYSKRYEKPVPELGVFTPNNGFLSYRFSDSPFGPFHDGGDISFNGGEILHDSEGVGTMTYQWGNNHGSIMEVDGMWYVFYHRQTGLNEYSRQAMIEPVDVAFGMDGKLYIGDIKYLNGEPVSSKPVEMTSQGAQINGLDAYSWISAGYSCHIFGSKKRAYIRPCYEQKEDISTPVVDITDGTTVGFRYVQFGENTPKTVTVCLEAAKKVIVKVRIDSYRGRVVADLSFIGDSKEMVAPLTTGIVGKHAVYFEFLAEDVEESFSFDRFTFDR
ncbi:family 43 glycosylhydrolase [Butyrivibrio sp. YAB3001]|uniref:family 43 glycosylhydrolase n=1 Tax=Butyrivibrio sp. YAB3001 TaxID=1520812 RepID=UPI0008F66478|nr:family 43 glycosylhydrolase [Butyrivibrio sp. YAB3001]SFC28050.1 Carbohydrate binding module (family 6) [Butyrivibrio sp. YAB3001]